MMPRHLRTDVAALYALLGDDSQLHDAFDVADTAHAGQMRSTATGKVPYILHPLRVLFRLRGWGVADPTALVAALLHDTVEDAPEKTWQATGSASSDGTPRERALLGIEQRFGIEVARVVAGLTNSQTLPYLEHVSAATADPRVLVVKLSDFYDNALGLEAGHPRLEKLRAKYAPLYPVLASRLAASEEAQSLLPAWRDVLRSLT